MQPKTNSNWRIISVAINPNQHFECLMSFRFGIVRSNVSKRDAWNCFLTFAIDSSWMWRKYCLHIDCDANGIKKKALFKNLLNAGIACIEGSSVQRVYCDAVQSSTHSVQFQWNELFFFRSCSSLTRWQFESDELMKRWCSTKPQYIWVFIDLRLSLSMHLPQLSAFLHTNLQSRQNHRFFYVISIKIIFFSLIHLSPHA